MAGAIGTSLFTALWQERASLHHEQLVQHISLSHDTAMQTLALLEAAGHSREQALAVLNRSIDQQAFTMAVTDVFQLSSILFLALIGLVWLSAPRPAAGPAR